jgi:hypothetical protein
MPRHSCAAPLDGWPRDTAGSASSEVALGPNVSVGSKAPFCQSVGHFRSTPINRHRQTASACLKGADSVEKVFFG